MAEYKFGQVSAALFGYSEQQVTELKKENEFYNKVAKKRNLNTSESISHLSGSYNRTKTKISRNKDIVSGKIEILESSSEDADTKKIGKMKNKKQKKAEADVNRNEKMKNKKHKKKKAQAEPNRVIKASSPEKLQNVEKTKIGHKGIKKSLKASKQPIKKTSQMESTIISLGPSDSLVVNKKVGKKDEKTQERLIEVKSKNANVQSQEVKKSNKKRQVKEKVVPISNQNSNSVQSRPGQFNDFIISNSGSDIEENVESIMQKKKRKEISKAKKKPVQCNKPASQNEEKTIGCVSNSLSLSSKEVSKNFVQKDKETTLFVGNIPMSMTKKKLIKLFKEYGAIQSVRFRSATPAKPGMPKKGAVITKKFHPDRKSIHAYIDFSQKESATLALEKNGYVVDGNHLRVDYTHQKPNKSLKNKVSVFIGNLPFAVQDETLYGHFEKCGAIEGVRVIREQNTGLGKGFAYVTFKERDSVNLALALNDSEVDGRKIRVSKATDYKNTRERMRTPTKGKRRIQTPTKGKKALKHIKSSQRLIKKKRSESSGNNKKKFKRFKPKTNQSQARRRLKNSAMKGHKSK